MYHGTASFVVVCLFFIATMGCGAKSSSSAAVQLVADPDLHAVLKAYIRHTPGEFEVVESPRSGDAVVVRLDTELSCSECYEIRGSGHDLEISSGDVLGLQYGLSALMEAWGYRFHHPFNTVVPDTIPSLSADHPAFRERVEPDMALRSLHMHTLHPIEGMKAFWMGGEGEAARAEAVIDWVVKNRGNDLQWVSLDDVMLPSVERDWRAHTEDVIAYAHRRGLTVGVGIQLFGSANLQQAFDLLDRVGSAEENRVQIEERLSLLTSVGFDRFNLSFGEFFGEEPETFVSMVNQVGSVLDELDSDAQLTTLIHVGDSEDQRVIYGGEEMIYYFLAQFADPEIVPWVHTVMLYNLFEDAGGAYHHETFDEHRTFLAERIEAGEPTAYFPESAYWIAFDNSVPVYLPAYMRSRWLDMEQMRAEVGPIPAHVLFSSGWEWGYWQTDVATLRLNHSLDGGVGVAPGWTGIVEWMYAPWGEEGAAVSDAIIALANAQADALIGQRLMAYFAGRDSTIDVGEAIGVVAQPMRVRVDRLDDLSAEERAAFESSVLEPLSVHIDEISTIAEGLPDTAGDPWLQEVADGVSVTRLRGAFVLAIYRAGLAHLNGLDSEPYLADIDTLLEEARTVVVGRHGQLHDPNGAQWIEPAWSNPTIYQYGYLLRSDELCFWEREHAKLQNLMEGSTVATVPGCAL